MFNKFNLDNHYEEVSSNKKNNNYKKIDNSTLRLIAIVSIAFIGLLVFLGIDKIMNNKSITFRQDNSKDIVYTLYESKKADQKIPYFNTSNKDLQLINDNISKYVKPYLNNSKVKISYDYNLSGIILSLVVKIYNEENYSVKFRSYNINLDEESLLSDEYLLNYYSIDSSEIKQKVKTKLNDYYLDEAGKYFELQEVDFDRYLEMRLFNSIDTKDYAYYVKNGKLTAYVPFNPYSIYGEEEYFTEDRFNITLSKAPEER
ncbi:MAG: hypothetical protein IJL76_03220 [Bacilli bacterium]|nr:hypothetical protein [Bacilli bacterium]